MSLPQREAGCLIGLMGPSLGLAKIRFHCSWAGILAAAEIGLPDQADFTQVESGSIDRLLVLDAIQDPGNVGTLLRTATALGWQGAYLLPGAFLLFALLVVADRIKQRTLHPIAFDVCGNKKDGCLNLIPVSMFCMLGCSWQGHSVRTSYILYAMSKRVAKHHRFPGQGRIDPLQTGLLGTRTWMPRSSKSSKRYL